MAKGHDEFRIYVADLLEYNAGRIVGQWLSPRDYCDAEALQAAVAVAISHPDHEYAVHDSEGVTIGEYESIDNIMRISDAVDVFGAEKVNAYLLEGRSNDLTHLREQIADVDHGEYESREDWASECIDSAYDLEKMLGHLACYFDYASFARDAELSGDVTFVPLQNGNVWVLAR